MPASRCCRRGGFSAERGDGHVRVAIAPAEAERVTQALAHERQWVTDLRPEVRSLEDLFLELTGVSDASSAQPLDEVPA